MEEDEEEEKEEETLPQPCPGPWWDPLCHGGTPLCPAGSARPFRGMAANSRALSTPTQHFVPQTVYFKQFL